MKKTYTAEEEAAFKRETRLEAEAVRLDGKGGAIYSFPQTQEDPPEIETAVSFIRSDALPVKAINWLWHGYLALGKLHVLCGRPGCGKTSIAVSFAAAVTCGCGWPDNSWSVQGDVVIWSGEDDPADTLIPKLMKSGAELSRVHFVDKTKDIDGTRAFDPSTDMDALRRKIRLSGNVKLLVIDPLVSAVRGDDHKNGAVRRGLQPLADLAASERVAVLGISHFSKNSIGKDPVDRVTGSLAYGAAARIVLAASKDKSTDTRVFCRAKSNIGADDGGFQYDLKQAPLEGHWGIVSSFVEWGSPITGEARDILATAEGTEKEPPGSALTEAMQFLKDALTNGAREASDVQEEAAAYGISERTLKRARAELGIKPTRKGFGKDGCFIWSLPDL